MTAATIAAVLFLACAWMLASILLALVVGPYLGRVRQRVDAAHARHEADAAHASGDDERVRQMIAYHNAYRAAVAEDAGNDAAWDQAVALGNSHTVSGTPIHDMLRRRHEEFARDLARIHQLDEWRGES